jgi:TolB-like protein/tetratricopeptide (TPR) repeat protein
MSPTHAAGARSEGPSESEIRTHVEKLLASRPFVRSARLARFLNFAVDHALAGTGGEVKEYLVGVEVFDRRPGYDPRIDPIVRVEARRLRAKLKAYYASAGKADAIVVQFPKGAYVPVFRTRAGKSSRMKAPASSGAGPSSLAVLPFANLTPEAGSDYFSDGLTEELIHSLTRVEGLRVVAWHSAAQMRGQEDLAAIRERLKVDAVLKGAVRCSAERVRVTAQLIDTCSRAVLWSDRYDREMGGVLAIQEEIAHAIVATVRPALATVAPSGPRRQPNPESYNLCLQGRFHANMRTAAGLRQSAVCFEKAVRADPESAVAHAGLADAYSLLSEYGLANGAEVMPKAEMAALRALELDPQSAEALSALAFVRSAVHWKWREGRELYERAIAANPGYAKARHWYATDFLALHGHFDEAFKQIQIARGLDPLSLIIHEGYAYLHILRRDYETALESLRQTIGLEMSFHKGYGSMGRALSLMGRYSEAIEVLESARQLSPELPSVLAALGQTYGLAGRTAQARRCLEDLLEMSARTHVAAASFAILHLGLGEYERSLDWLELGASRREIQLCQIKMHPLYDPLRSEPQFERLLAQINFLP